MDGLDAKVWLNAWVEENFADPSLRESRADMAREAEVCRAAAEAEGISRAALDDAAGGDLQQFLFDRQAMLHRRE
jgi:hypothetical protein